jgi:outer membrane lipase/esterase
MPRTTRLAVALAFALSGYSTVQAQEFSNTISFGDSLTDAGNVAALSGLPAGNSFTTNPDPVAAQVIAAAFGFDQTNSMAGGSNYAVGGACVRPNSSTFTCTNDPSGVGAFSLTNQLGGYLSANGGHADPNALYTMWGGANDIFAAPTQTDTAIAANTFTGLINTLQDAGARYIVVFNLPDLGLTPQFRGTSSQIGMSGFSVTYNSTLNTGLAGLGDGIIPINTFGLLNEIIANPGTYGFTNVTGQACGTGSSSVACGPAGSGLPYTYADGTNETYLFADSIHPTGGAHRLLANAVVATIVAPGQVSVAAEVPLQVYEDHAGLINTQLFALRGMERAEGDVRGYANLQLGSQEYDASSNTAAVDSNLFTLTAGADFRYNDRASLGAAISFGGSNSDNGAGGVDGKEVLASFYGVMDLGRGYVNAIASLGSNSLDIERAIPLGTGIRIESGNTDAKHFGFELGGGMELGNETLRHGPYARLTWQQVDIDGYAEESNDSTAMYFNDYDRDSLVARVGYQFDGNFRARDRAVHPYGRLAYAKETQDDVTYVQAGSTSMSGHFTMAGFIPSDHWAEAELGVNVEVNDATQAFFGYRAHFSDDTQSRNSLNLGVRMDF